MYMNTFTIVLDIRVFDDQELFEEQKHFSIADMIEISSFLNHLLFHIIWDNQAVPIPDQCQSLLTMLYHRDSQRRFCSEDHWLIRSVGTVHITHLCTYSCTCIPITGSTSKVYLTSSEPAKNVETCLFYIHFKNANSIGILTTFLL